MFLYAYVGNATLRRVDPFGLKAWKSEVGKLLTEEVIQNIHDCIARKMTEYINQKKKLDCADAALSALIECTAEAKLPMTLPVWDAKNKKWAYLRSEDEAYIDVESYIKDATAKIGAISLLDRDRITSSQELSKLKPGDLIIFDLREHGSDEYGGHTMVVLENDEHTGTLVVGEGHLSSPVEKSTYSYNEIFSKWKEPYKGKGRTWNCHSCLK